MEPSHLKAPNLRQVRTPQPGSCPVRLRAFDLVDIESLVRWVNDERVTRYLSQSFVYPISRSEGSRWLEEISKRHSDKVFAIETRGGRLIGSAGLHGIHWIDRKAELAVMIGERDCWNRGFGTHAVQEMLKLSFGKMNLRRIYLRVASGHAGAIHVYEKCGFQCEGRLRKDRYVGRGYEDTLLMAVLKEEFLDEGRKL